ncbi:phytoene desaturase family protein [Candidatus Poribacteria bacterium]
MKSAIVMGAGLGGIALAARLAKSGYAVTLLEKNSRPGGRMDLLESDGFRFDTGPTLFLMPEIFAETYAAVGERMEDQLDLVRLDPTYRVHFHDRATFDLTADLNSMSRQLDAIEPGAFEAFLRFMSEGYRHYHLSLKHFVGRNFSSWWEYLSPGNIPLMFRVKALVKHYKNTGRYFTDPRLRALFSFQNMYLGLSPYDAMATYSLLQYSELADGVWFPRGGMYKVIDSLTAICQGLGVNLRYESPVSSIDVDGSQAKGVTLEDGRSLTADVVVANADLPYVYSELLPDDGTAKRLRNKKYSSSAIMFYWGIKGERSPLLHHHNVFLADHRYKDSFDQIFHDLTLPDEPSFYVCAPTRTDPDFAPLDGDSLLVLVPVGHIDDDGRQNWDEIKKKARGTVLSHLTELGLTDLDKNIVFEKIIGPEDYLEHLNLAKGSAFGLSHNFLQVGYLRPHNRHKTYKNLYFVGASTHPGTGLPMVLISARLVAELILGE